MPREMRIADKCIHKQGGGLGMWPGGGGGSHYGRKDIPKPAALQEVMICPQAEISRACLPF